MLPGRWNNMLAFGVCASGSRSSRPGSWPWTNPKSTSSPAGPLHCTGFHSLHGTTLIRLDSLPGRKKPWPRVTSYREPQKPLHSLVNPPPTHCLLARHFQQPYTSVTSITAEVEPDLEQPAPGHRKMSASNFVPNNQHRNLRACMVCSVVQTHARFMTAGCPNCEPFLELAGSADAIAECTSQVFDGLITVAETKKSWVARWQRLEGYAPGVYAVKVEGTVNLPIAN